MKQIANRTPIFLSVTRALEHLSNFQSYGYRNLLEAVYDFQSVYIDAPAFAAEILAGESQRRNTTTARIRNYGVQHESVTRVIRESLSQLWTGFVTDLSNGSTPSVSCHSLMKEINGRTRETARGIEFGS